MRVNRLFMSSACRQTFLSVDSSIDSWSLDLSVNTLILQKSRFRIALVY